MSTKILFVGIGGLLAALAVFFYGVSGWSNNQELAVSRVLAPANVEIGNAKLLRKDLSDAVHLTGIIRNKSPQMLSSVQLAIDFYGRDGKVYSTIKNINIFVPSGKSREFDEYLLGDRRIQELFNKEYALGYEILSTQGVDALTVSNVINGDGPIRLWQWRSDMNADGRVTLTDGVSWLGWLYYYPGDFAIDAIQNTKAGNYVGLTSADFGGALSLLVSLCFWLVAGFYLQAGWLRLRAECGRFKKHPAATY
jgi:hypothetical protein